MALTLGTVHNNIITIRRLIKMEIGTSNLAFCIIRCITHHLQILRNCQNMKVVLSFPRSGAQSMLSCRTSKVMHTLSCQT